MPTYKFRAKDFEGLEISDFRDAENLMDLEIDLEKEGYILLEADEKRGIADNDIFAKFKRVKLKDKVLFSVQLATLIKAGVTLIAAIEVLEDQIENIRFRNSIIEVRKDVSGGMTFSEALSKHPWAFSSLYVNMVKAGEASGKLDVILESLAGFQEKSHDNQSKVKSALIYPGVMVFVAMAVVTFLILIVLPKFEAIFSGVGVALPIPTRFLLWLSKFIQSYWWLIILVPVGIIFLIKRYIETEKGRWQFDTFKFRVPIFGSLIKKSSIANFTRTFGILVESAVPLLETLDIVEKTTGNVTLSAVVEGVKSSVREGGGISTKLEESTLFPKMVAKMIFVGENSGSLDSMLLKVSDFYDKEVENEIKAMTSIIEPILIVVMGIVIGGIVLSVMLPMFDMLKLAKM